MKLLANYTGFACLIAMTGMPPALAQSDNGDQGTRFVIGELTEIVVTDSGRGNRAEIPGSVDLINRDQLRNEHVNLTMDLFKKVPGVNFSRFNQGIISADIGIRGYNAEGEIPSTKLLIDGIPSNLHVGMPEMDALFPMELDHIEVVKGTNDPRYGLLNIAGNINMTSRRDIAREVELLGGSFGTREAQAYAGFETGNWTQHYFLGHRDTDGYRDNAALDKTTVSGKWFYEHDERLSLGLIARYFEFSADAPGYLSYEDARAAPRRSYDFSDTDGGDKETVHLSAHLDYALTGQLDWNLRAWVQNFERQRWVRFTAAHDQQERYEDERQSGLVSTLSWRPRAETLVSWGLNYEAQDNTHQRFASVERSRTGPVLRDHRFDYDSYGSYLQWQEDVTPDLRLVSSLRVDRLRGDFRDVFSGADRDMNDYGSIWQPKFSAIYTVNPQLDLFANVGRSFQAGVGAGAYGAGRSVDVSVNDGWDLGASYYPADTVALRLSRWGQYASDELVSRADGSGDFENVGTTHRRGWELTANWWASEQFTVWGSYTLQKALLSNPGPLNESIRGNDLNHVPGYTASLGLEYEYGDWTATLFTSFQGDYELNTANDRGRYGAYALSDLTLLYGMDWGDLSFRVNNLFDRHYEYVWHDIWFTGDNLHSPGSGRSFDVALAIRF